MICLDTKYQLTTVNFEISDDNLHTCMSATELKTSELVRAGRRQTNTTSRAGDCIFSALFDRFMSSSTGVHFLIASVLCPAHGPALLPRPLVLCWPAAARLRLLSQIWRWSLSLLRLQLQLGVSLYSDSQMLVASMQIRP